MIVKEVKGISYTDKTIKISIDDKEIEITPDHALEITQTLIDYLELPYNSIDFIEDEIIRKKGEKI